MSGLSRTPGKRVWVNSPPRVRIPPSPPHMNPSDENHLGFVFLASRLAVKARCNVPKSTPLVGEALAQAHTPALLIPFVLWHPIAPRDSELVAAMASGDTLAVDLTKPVVGPKQHLAPLAAPPSAGHPPRSRWRKADRLRHARWALQHPAVLPAQMHGETNLPTYPPSARTRPSRVKWGRLVAGSQRVSSGRRTAYLKDQSHRVAMQSQESSKCVVQPQPVFDRCSAAVRAARSQFIPGKAQFVARRWWKDSSS